MDAMLIGRKLVQARGEQPQTEVARELGISTSAMSMYESGERVPRDEIKERIARYYNTTVGFLFFDEKVHTL